MNKEDIGKIDEEPNWFEGKLNSAIKYIPPGIASKEPHPVLQDDFLKPFLFDIGDYGLQYAFKKYYNDPSDADKYKYTKTKYPKRVIVVGGGMAGLVAGYELAQAGHNVLILEKQHRVGGRVKTVGSGKFSKGLWADVGAMREPGTGQIGWTGPSHFMTDYYSQKFQLPLKEFVQSNDQTYYAFYGKPPIKKSEWRSNPGKYCDEFWPGWRKNIKPGIEITDIMVYWMKTAEPIEAQLYKFLEQDPENGWSKWIQKWSIFSMNTLLRSSLKQIIIALKDSDTYEPSDDNDLSSLSGLLPWSVDAVVGYTTLAGGIPLDSCLAEMLRGSLGKYFSGPMHTFKDGLETLPWSFLGKNRKGWNKQVDLSKCIKFGVTVEDIQFSESSVTVLGHNETNKKAAERYAGDMVIVTVPLNIARQIKFSPPLPGKYYKAMDHIYIAPSTKVLLQCRTRFWEAHGINGGSTSTDLPITSINYPSNPGFKIPISERGILMGYCFSNNAVAFDSRNDDDAIAQAIKEIATIHPEIEENFEVGAVQSWNNDPSAQGAFAWLKPEQYLAQEILFYPHQSVYFCGESLSHCNGWIQGALVSGLRSAYQLFVRNELKCSNHTR